MGEQGSDMEKMIEMFLGMDKNDDGFVDLSELRTACQEKKLDMKQVNGWLSRYDTNKDGKISLDEFCDGLGLGKQEMRIERYERQREREGFAKVLNPDVSIIASTMSLDKQVDITNKFVELLKETSGRPEDLNEVAKNLKDYLDKQYGRVWQTVLVAGSYWMKFSHEPFMSLQFKCGPHICLVWRTPCIERDSFN
ncbi:tegument antigen [Clonorchis sinensis]|uniref:Tegument antigen n=1 Tax=Clonorchis sinensis TaxID=79923 RepID=G7YVB2_CLOSI|nr:tegument antigen [Clonorchis sinensis]